MRKRYLVLVSFVLAFAPLNWSAHAETSEQCTSQIRKNPRGELKKQLVRLDVIDSTYLQEKLHHETWSPERQEAEIDSILTDLAKMQEAGLNCAEENLAQTISTLAVAHSGDPDRAVPALEALTHPQANAGLRERFYSRLMAFYRKAGRFDDMKRVASSNPVSDDLIVAQIKLGEFDQAGSSLLKLIDEMPSNVSPLHYHLLIALAERQGDAEQASTHTRALVDRFGAEKWPQPLPGLPENKLDALVERVINPAYEPEITKMPVPAFPPNAAAQGLQGKCTVLFYVDALGVPRDVSATCTENSFKRESIRAMERARYAPIQIEGQKYGSGWILYPIEFTLQ